MNKKGVEKPKESKRPTLGGPWYSFEEMLEQQSTRSKTFKKAYEEEVARLLLAAQIRGFRKDKKLTQAAVAKRAGMPQSVIARLESGTHSVSVDTLQKVAHAFGKRVELV